MLQVGVTVGILVWVVIVWGPAPFAAATRVLTVPAAVAGLLLGAFGVLLQAGRWRLVARTRGLSITPGAAVSRCWQAAFLNAVLPGGLAGDALRAVEQPRAGTDSPGATLKRSAGTVTAERLAGTTVVFTAAGIALLALQPAVGLLSLAVAAVCAAVAWPWLRWLTRGDLARVAGLSVAGWAVFAAMFVVALLVVAPDVPLGQAPALAAISLAGMSVPLNVAGWGPREGTAALGFLLVGQPPGLGVAVSVAYGLLALVSVLPGGLVLLARTLRRDRLRPSGDPDDAGHRPPRPPSDHPRSRHARRAAQERP
ncbi:hypothetical protein GCM10011512_12450 [Tersicoccus solisilvae]|uniref:Flippase-like domain-containing protein n=1 Tax=Tersicoccus solisilvae TaxID=1882339 RepID=A0ABQ1NXJ0_9MICC|nr:hypothetical protein GCM10011512_12450 [Tersicoccus solisilvae]